METLRIEFKSTARVPLTSDVPAKVINESVIKTVAAFMNSEGGTLGIGISDDGDILGIQPDLDFKQQDLDGYQNWLSTLFMNAMGQAVVAKGVNIRFETVEDRVVCLVDVSKSSSPVYADTIKGKETFYIRVGNTTRILTGAEMVKYSKDRTPAVIAIHLRPGHTLNKSCFDTRSFLLLPSNRTVRCCGATRRAARRTQAAVIAA